MTALFLLTVTWRPTGRSAAEDEAAAETEWRATNPSMLSLYHITVRRSSVFFVFVHAPFCSHLVNATNLCVTRVPEQQHFSAASTLFFWGEGHLERIGLHMKRTNSDANARRRLSYALDWPPDCWIICKIGSAQAAFVIICRTQVWNLLPVQSKRRDAEAMPGLSRVTVPELRRRRGGASSHWLVFSLASCLIAFWLLCLVFFSLPFFPLAPPLFIVCDFPSLSATHPVCRPVVFKLMLLQLPHGIQKLFWIREV